MLYNLLIIRFILIIISMVPFILPFNAYVKYYMMYISLYINVIITIICLICWPNTIHEINIYNISILTGYNINFSLNFIGLYFSFMVDILIWLCFSYNRYLLSTGFNIGRHNLQSIRTYSSDELSLMLFYIISVGFFSSNDFVTTGLLFEFQNVPLLLMINSKYYQPRNFTSKPYIYNPEAFFSSGNTYYITHNMPIFPAKGIGMASFLLLAYGFLSGIFLFFGFNSLYLFTNCSNISKCIDILDIIEIPNNVIFGIWLIFISGAIKLAIFPFHVWLGKVHVESPTVGSVLLAAIALKSGFYLHILFWNHFNSFNKLGFIIYNLNYIDFILLLFMIGALFSSLSLFFQHDLKRWIALFSISHMQLFYFLFFAVNMYTSNYNTLNILNISIIVGMIGHSFISAGLFFVGGYISDETGSRILNEIGNVLSIRSRNIFFLLLLSNSAFPMTVLFICELMAYTQLAHWNFFFTIYGLVISSTCLLSSLYIYSKYFIQPATISKYRVNNDSFLFYIISPLQFIVFLLGFQIFTPILFFL